MQLELFPWEPLTPHEKAAAYRSIRNQYWSLRNLRGEYHEARIRGIYRRIASEKKRLLMAGVKHGEILEFLRCCRLQCSRHKRPFEPCEHCL